MEGREFNKDAQPPRKKWRGYIMKAWETGHVTSYFPEDMQHDCRKVGYAIRRLVPFSGTTIAELLYASRKPDGRAALQAELKARDGKVAGRQSLAAALLCFSRG